MNVLNTISAVLLVVGCVFWFFVFLEKDGRIENCEDVVWSSNGGFHECVDLDFDDKNFRFPKQ